MSNSPVSVSETASVRSASCSTPTSRPVSRQSIERERVMMVLQSKSPVSVSETASVRSASCSTPTSRPVSRQSIERERVKMILQALKIPGGIERYLAALRFALELTCEKSNDKEGRINCLKMSAHVALALTQENMHEPLQLLVEFCIDMSDLCIVVTRSYVCALAGLLLNLNKLIANRLKDRNPQADYSPLSEEFRSSLFNLLSKRLLDISPLVRSEALKAIATLQDQQSKAENYKLNSPKRLLLAHLNDVSDECRVITLKKLMLSSKEEVDLVVNMALSDSEERVRRAAVVRLIKDVNLKILSIKQRMDLVQAVMNIRARNPNHAGILNDLLGQWLKTACGREKLPEGNEELISFYCTASSHLLRFLEPLTQEKVSHDLMLHSLHYCRDRMGLDSYEVHDFIKALNRNVGDINLHRHNCSKLIEEGWSSIEQANAVFYWRCLLDFCKLKCITETDWSECHYRLLPTMRTFCELIERYTTSVLSNDEAEALFALKNFTVMQLLKLISLFDDGDPSGWKSWRCMCENILSNMQLKLSSTVVNEFIKQMYTHLWPSIQNNDEALSSICDLTSSIVHKALFPNATLLASQTIGIGNNETMIESENNDVSVDDNAIYRCIMIVSAMLKTNRYKQMNTLLRGVLENIIEKSVVAADINCRQLAFEAMGILAMYDRRVAFEKTILIKETLEIDERLRPTMLNILCNMTLLHGYAAVSQWYGSSSNSQTSNTDVLQVFAEYSESLDQETSFTACECLCKMFLKEANPAWVGVLSRLLLKAFDPATNDNAKLKACLVTFIPVFAEWSREHQLLLVEAFPETFDTLRNDQQFIGSLSRINVGAVGSCLVHATSSQLLTGDDKQKGPVHPLLCQKILAALSDDPEDDYAPVYCNMLMAIDVNDWTDIAQINATIVDVEDVVDLYSDTEETRAYIRALTNFSKRLRKRIANLETSIAGRKVSDLDVKASPAGSDLIH
ncbi:unnamed protein product [Thelazia callipaeda]|uniref:Cnd3 domain-containing protein n=1 Tax=Thelazia callipaeda TaxID=103827 RepID=A0A0N5D5H3_THECL|nr:unnamed protein product [Thelazia callipaeda]